MPWAALAVGAAMLVALWLVPWSQVRRAPVDTAWKDRFEARNEARRTLLQILAGAVLAIGAWNAWKTYQLSQGTQRLAQETQRLAHETHITTRFTETLELLDHERLEIRLGAIHALGRIAHDSPRDHWPVITLLATYVQTYASEEALIASMERYGKPGKPWSLFQWPPLEVAEALRVIGDRAPPSKSDQERRVDLRQTTLVGADLRGANLRRADLRNVDFAGWRLMEASWGRFKRMTDFRQADLRETLLDNAGLGGDLWEGADLAGASLADVRLYAADLHLVRGLTQEQLSSTCDVVAGSSQVPEGLSPPDPCP